MRLFPLAINSPLWYTLTLCNSLFVLYLETNLGKQTLGNVNLYPCCHMFPSHILWVLTLEQRTKVFKPHAHMHHIGINFIIMIIALLTLYYSTTSHATLVLCYHACMHVNTTYLLNITCTLVATCVMLGRLDCTSRTLFAYAYCGPYKQHKVCERVRRHPPKFET